MAFAAHTVFILFLNDVIRICLLDFGLHG
jgi:hypothetical protein